jgi:excisionase family DNA binding protein
VVLQTEPTSAPIPRRDSLRELSIYTDAQVATMNDRALYTIKEARELLGRISRNSIYALLRSGELPSVVIGCRRFISAAAISDLITKSTTTLSPSEDSARLRKSEQGALPLPLVTASRVHRRSSEA